MAYTAVFIHDQTGGYARTIARHIKLKDGVSVLGISTAREALELIRGGGLAGIDCVIIHKDLGQWSGERDGLVDIVVGEIHRVNKSIRVGLVSGEYPGGSRHVLSLGVDFYFPTTYMMGPSREWVIEQIKRGPVLPDEISLRGREVTTPASQFSSSPETRF